MAKANIWYCKSEYSQTYRFSCGSDLIAYSTISRVKHTHVLLKTIDASCADEAWQKMQGEFWSPKGEANGLIAGLGLDHTSMDIGDVVEIDGVWYKVEATGFSVLEA